MEIQASRLGARTGPDGEPILLLDQNRARWDQLLIRRGLAALARAEAAGRRARALRAAGRDRCLPCAGATADETDWARIAELYGELVRRTPSPVVELNRAVAVSMAQGPAGGLDLVDALTAEPALKNYHLLPSVRGDFLKKLGRMPKHAPSSSVPPCSRRMHANANCCSTALPRSVPNSSWPGLSRPSTSCFWLMKVVDARA